MLRKVAVVLLVLGLALPALAQSPIPVVAASAVLAAGLPERPGSAGPERSRRAWARRTPPLQARIP